MKKINALAVTVAMLFVPMAFADDLRGVAQNANSVQGEKLDSGLGAMVLGEKLDSGLGELTQAEIDRIVTAAQQRSAGSNTRSEFRATMALAAMQPDYQVPPSNEGE